MCVVGEGEGRRGREGGREGEGREGGGWEGGKETNCMMISGPCVGIYTVSYVLTEGMFIALVLSMVAYAVMSQWKKRLMLFSN